MQFLLMGVHYFRFSFEDVLPELDNALAQLPQESTETPEASEVGIV
jgi:hypothetical protein